MPSFRTTSHTVTLRQFDVIGEDSEDPGLIRHAGLTASDGEQTVAASLVIEMGPPLNADGRSSSLKIDVCGCAEMTDDEAQKIRVFIDRHAQEHAAFKALGVTERIQATPKMYCAAPHAQPFFEEDGRYSRMRFSCAGFVFEAYKSARISLLALEGLPFVGMSDIQSVYGDQLSLLARVGVTTEEIGLGGEGPWQVMFCGYLFHALNREKESIRSAAFTPSLEHRYFPIAALQAAVSEKASPEEPPTA